MPGLEPGKASVAAVARLGHDLLIAMVSMHAKGLVWRDLHYGNVLVHVIASGKDVDEEVSAGRFSVMAIDFGIMAEAGSKPKGISGLTSLRAPEEIRAACVDHTAGSVCEELIESRPDAAHGRSDVYRVNPKSDVYSLGVVLFDQLCRGRVDETVDGSVKLPVALNEPTSPYFALKDKHGDLVQLEVLNAAGSIARVAVPDFFTPMNANGSELVRRLYECGVSRNSRDLGGVGHVLVSMLATNPEERLSAQEALELLEHNDMDKHIMLSEMD